MPRPRKSTEETFFDCFADWPSDDQAAALKVMEALHRQKKRDESRKRGETPAQMDLTEEQ